MNPPRTYDELLAAAMKEPVNLKRPTKAQLNLIKFYLENGQKMVRLIRNASAWHNGEKWRHSKKPLEKKCWEMTRADLDEFLAALDGKDAT